MKKCLLLLLIFQFQLIANANDNRPQIKDLKDNSWAQCKTSELHPIVRTSSPYMMYCQETGLGYLWGASHGNHHNGVWAYQMKTNEWINVLPTEENAKLKPSIIILKENILMTENERPLAAHQWGQMDLDTHQNRIYYFSHNGGNQGVLYNYGSQEDGFFPNLTKAELKKAQESQEAQPLWYYDIDKNKWFYEKTHGAIKEKYPENNKGVFRYFPPHKMFYMTPRGGLIDKPFRVYNPVEKEWNLLNVEIKFIEKNTSKKFFCHAPTLYVDSIKKFVMVDYYLGTLLFDPESKQITQIIGVMNTPYGNLDGPSGSFVFDSIHQKVLAIYVDHITYKSGTIMAERDLPLDREKVRQLDIEEKKWNLLPSNDSYPALPQKPKKVHHYFDPKLNAILIYRGGYNALDGETWLYRYKN